MNAKCVHQGHMVGFARNQARQSGLRSPIPAMSAGKICDEGHTVTFSDVMAVVHNKKGEELCKCHRPGGGLCVAKLNRRLPAGSGRPE